MHGFYFYSNKDLNVNISKLCITLNFSLVNLADHSQAGRRADQKAEEAGILVLFLHLFLFFSLRYFLYFLVLRGHKEFAGLPSSSLDCFNPLCVFAEGVC